MATLRGKISEHSQAPVLEKRARRSEEPESRGYGPHFEPMIDSAPERVARQMSEFPPLSDPAPTSPDAAGPDAAGRVRGLNAKGVRLRRKRSAADWLAFLLSAVLSPYIVIPVGTVGIVYVRSHPPLDNITFEAWQPFLLWVSISLLFSTALPLFYILFGMWRGTISDVHVMERDQRGGPFLIAIAGGFFSAYLLHLLQAPTSIWGLSLIQAVNGLVIYGITQVTKISVHVSVLSATVLGATILHPHFPPYAFLWLIPLLVWARSKRGRHSLWQGVGGFVVGSTVTTAVIAMLGLTDRLAWLWQRL